VRSQSKHQAPLTGKVVLDAMGSDHAPHVEIDGAIRNAIRSVKEFSDHRTSERIEEGIKYEPRIARIDADVDLRVSV